MPDRQAPPHQLLVVGGRQRAPRTVLDGQQNWHGYDGGVVLCVEPSNGAVSTRLTYTSPPEVKARDAAISFQAGALVDGLLYVGTETEVLVYAVPGFTVEHYVTLPWFNDVHHVRPTPDGNLLVASAGLELVLEITRSGDVLRTWNVLGEDPWARFDPQVDWRTVASTKPHRAHPNFVFYVDEDIWVTRFHQGDAVSLTTPGRRIDISDQRIHDGVLHEGQLYFTTVDGHVVIVDAATLRVVESLDLKTFHPGRSTSLGWCRGVLVDGDRIWVGFSRIRPTRFRENVSWVSRGFRRELPTHIACYDRVRRTCLAEIDLERCDLGAVYGIFPMPATAR